MAVFPSCALCGDILMGLGVLALFFVAPGCDNSAPSTASNQSAIGPGSQATPASDSQDLLTRLLDVKSTDTLKALLQRNGVDPSGIRRIGTMTAYKAEDLKNVSAIVDAGWIQSNGKKLAIICAIAAANKRESLPASPDVPIVYIFGEDGRIVKSFGSRDYMSKESAKDIIVLSLGTKDAWFVLVERWDFAANQYRISNVYLLDDPIEKVLEVRHLYDSIGYTGNEQQAERHGSFIQFSRTKSHAMQHISGGVPADESSQPRLEWIAAERKFKGPSKVSFGGEDLYEVNIKESMRFQPTELGVK